MKKLPALVVFLATGGMAGQLAAQDRCEYRRDISEALETSPGNRVRVQAGAGLLRVTGREDLTQVLVTGTACASSVARLEETGIRTEVDAAELSIETVIPESSGWFGLSEPGRIDLIIEVPAGAMLDVTDGSGSVEIAGVRRGATIDDGSGSLEIVDVAGELRVDDGSGTLTIRELDGSVRLSDGSGSVSIERVRGSVDVEDDGSGSLEIRDVTGDVLVREDGSGGIEVDRIGGDLVIDRDGSGGIRVGEIAGLVRIPED